MESLHTHSSCGRTCAQFVCPYINTVSVPLHAHSLCVPTYAQLVKGIPKKEKRKKICNVSYIVIVIQLLNMHISNKLLSYIIISLLQVFKRKNGRYKKKKKKKKRPPKKKKKKKKKKS